MRNKIWILVTMTCLAIIPFATAQAQLSAAPGTTAATAGVMNAIPSTTLPMAASNAATGTVSDKSGMKEHSKVAASPAVKCTYAYSQAYGSCPQATGNDCTYTHSQAYGSCPKGE